MAADGGDDDDDALGLDFDSLDDGDDDLFSADDLLGDMRGMMGSDDDQY